MYSNLGRVKSSGCAHADHRTAGTWNHAVLMLGRNNMHYLTSVHTYRECCNNAVPMPCKVMTSGTSSEAFFGSNQSKLIWTPSGIVTNSFRGTGRTPSLMTLKNVWACGPEGKSISLLP